MVRRIAVIVFWLLAWQALSWAINSPYLFCGPVEACQYLFENAPTPAFWITVASSFARIMAGFIAAMVLGIVLGALSARSRFLSDLLSPPIHVIKSTPVVCFIALLLVWMGSSATTSVISAMVAFPPFYFAMKEIRDDRDKEVAEMLRSFDVARWKKALFFRLPQSGPYLKVAIKTSVGMAWKAGVAAELIGLAAESIGEQVYLGKLSLDPAAIIAWTVVVIFFGWLSEKIVMAAMNGILALPRILLRRMVTKAASASPLSKEAIRPKAIDIAVLDVHKSFGDEQVLQGFALDLKKGSKTCIMAPSGAGKTTLARMIASIDKDFSGSIQGIEDGMASVLFQDSRLFGPYSVEENLALVASSPEELRTSLDMLDDLFPGDDTIKEKRASELSGGMKRRVELARALVHPSSIVILDEPFSGLDDLSRSICAKTIDSRLEGRTLIFTTHRKEDASILDAEIVNLCKSAC